MSKIKWLGPVVAVVLLALAMGGPSLGGKGGKGKPGGGGEPTHTVLDLGPGRANSVNDLGEAVGANDNLAIYWHVDANNDVTPQFLPDFNIFHCWASDLNNLGQAVGSVGGGVETPTRAVLWKNIGTDQVTVEYLGEPPAPEGFFTHSHAEGIDADGLIVGSATFMNAEGSSIAGRTALVWQANQAGYFELPSLGSASAFGVNDMGEVVGQALGEAVLWQLQFDEAGIISGVDGPKILGGLVGGQNSSAGGINNAGVIVGGSRVDADEAHAMRWQIDEVGNVLQTTDLGLLKGMDSSGASCVNDAGLIVGTSSRSIFKRPGSDGFLYENGSMKSLTKLLSSGPFDTIDNARGINEFDWICGRARLNKAAHAFIAIPNQ